MADLESLVRHANDPAIAKELRDRFPHPYTEADARAWLGYASAQAAPTDLTIEVDGEAAGGIGLIPRHDVERVSAEIGYWLGRRLWGRGIVTDAVRTLSAHALTVLGLTRVFALPFARNVGSRRVLEKAGFTLEGILRKSAIKDGVVLDQAMYARVQEDMRGG
jgi:RimJ/RimL family protein N-acetyltransferase